MAKTLQQLADYIETEPEIRNLINETVKYLQVAWPPEGATEVTVYQLKTVLTDAQIKALPTTPVVLVAATEVLGYAAPPTKLFMPIAAYAIFNKIGGGYGNNDAGLSFILAWGSDWSVEISDEVAMGGSLITQDGIIALIPFTTNIATIGDIGGMLQDNAIVIAASNGELGDITGGDPSNTLEVTVFYSIVDL